MALPRLTRLLGSALVLTLVMVAAPPAQAETSLYSLDRTASAVGFTVSASKIFTLKRKGEFKEFTGQLAFDPENPGNTHFELTVFTSSVDIHNAEHNTLLKSGAFFDVEHYPTLQFTSSTADVNTDGTLSVTGDMTIRGITQRMTIPIRLVPSPQPGGQGSVLESTFEIDRTMFGINGIAKTHGFNISISKKVQIHLAIATAPRPSTARP
jgi:polyisoprenoid-binding protein YceI